MSWIRRLFYWYRGGGNATPDLTALRPGDVLADTYEVRETKAGDTGVVYIARHLTWLMDVAVKVPLPAFSPLQSAYFAAPRNDQLPP